MSMESGKSARKARADLDEPFSSVVVLVKLVSECLEGTEDGLPGCQVNVSC